MQKAQLTLGMPANTAHGVVPSKGSASGMLSATHKAISATGKASTSGKQNAAKTPLSKFLLAESARHNTTNPTSDHHQLHAQIQQLHADNYSSQETLK